MQNLQKIKLAKKIIKRCWKLADRNGLELRQSYRRILKYLSCDQRFRNHPRNKGKARKDEKKAGHQGWCSPGWIGVVQAGVSPEEEGQEKGLFPDTRWMGNALVREKSMNNPCGRRIQLQKDKEQMEIITLSLLGKDIIDPEQATLSNQGRYKFTN